MQQCSDFGHQGACTHRLLFGSSKGAARFFVAGVA